MTDLRAAIEPKSDQLNADDLVAGSKTITITSVKLTGQEQAVAIHFDGDNEKPWKPCKSMTRLLVTIWATADGDQWIGRSVTLFNSPDVKWAGSEVGGIRVSHASHIDKSKRVMVTVSKGKKVPYTIEPLMIAEPNELTDDVFNDFSEKINQAQTMPELSKISLQIKAGNYSKEGRDKLAAVYTQAVNKIRGLQ